MRKDIVTTILGILVYSVMALAYVHATFPSKDIFYLIKERLDCIEQKLDRLIERE